MLHENGCDCASCDSYREAENEYWDDYFNCKDCTEEKKMTQEVVEFDSIKYKWKEIPGEGKCLVPIKGRELVSWDEIPWGSFFEYKKNIFLKVKDPNNKNDTIWIKDNREIDYIPATAGSRCNFNSIGFDINKKQFYIRNERNGIFPVLS